MPKLIIGSYTPFVRKNQLKRSHYLQLNLENYDKADKEIKDAKKRHSIYH